MKNVTHNKQGVTPAIGTETRRYAVVLLGRGVAYSEIEKETGIPASTLRVMKNRLKAGANDALQPVTLPVTQAEIVTNVTPEPEKITERFLPNMVKTFHPADLIYYACVTVACLGIVHAIPRVGVAVAGIYFSVALVAMLGIKTKTGWARLPHFLALAFVELVGFAGHTIWANAALWGNVKALPLSIYVEKYQNGAGETIPFYAGADADKPFYMSVAVAAIMFACAVYVCAISIQDQKKSDA